MNRRFFSSVVAVALLSLGSLMPSGTRARARLGLDSAALSSGDGPSAVDPLSISSIVVAGAWHIENQAVSIGSGRWKVTSRGTNTSGTTLYDCIARLTLDGSGTIFPDSAQKVGDFGPGESLAVTWTVEASEDTKGYVVYWCGNPEIEPKKRRSDCN